MWIWIQIRIPDLDLDLDPDPDLDLDLDLDFGPWILDPGFWTLDLSDSRVSLRNRCLQTLSFLK